MDLETTLRMLAPGLLRFCTGMMGSTTEGEDLAQESLAALVRFWKRSGPPDSPAAFVYSVARRQAGRFRRRWNRFLPLEWGGAQAEPSVDAEPHSIDRQRVEQVLTLLKKLPRQQREALLVALDSDLCVTEAAQVLGISVSAFKMRVHRARQCLKHWLEENHGCEQHQEDRR
ncbi:MAG: RNA polymerase sigma factor [Acidobacteriota bacterium]